VNEFVEECQREWRRLGVPQPVANEMAADLTADLEEAEAEGASPEDVLGNSAFDPRRFAAAWAIARGVTGVPVPDRPSLWRRPVPLALTVVLGALVVFAGLVLVVGARGHSFAVVSRRIVTGSGSIHLFAPGPGRIVVPGPPGPFAVSQVGNANPIAFAVLALAVVGLAVLAVLCWLTWPGLRRFPRPGWRRTQRWN
jgi:hypothetical protein